MIARSRVRSGERSWTRQSIVRLYRQYGHPSTATAFGPLDQHHLAIFGQVDRYQHGIGRGRKTFGHGRSHYKVLSRQRHFRDLSPAMTARTAHCATQGFAPSANGRAIFPMCYAIKFRYPPRDTPTDRQLDA